MNIIYTFDFINVGIPKLNEIEKSKIDNGCSVIKRVTEFDELFVKFDDGTVWACYKPYMYRAKLNKRWDRCLFDNKSLPNTDSNAFNYIINNHDVGGKIEFFN